MYRKFIAVILAAAVAVTALGSAPAQAGDRDIARFIAGVAAVGIIAATIHDQQRRGQGHDDGRGHVSRQQTYYPPVVHAPQRRHDAYVQPRQDHRARGGLPSSCLQTVSDRRGSRHVFSAGCLQRNDVRVGNLPDNCALTYVGQKGRARTGYDAGCLADYGYRTSRR